MRYIFLTDIDGTLLRADVPLQQKVILAAENYRKCGGLLAICSGRSLLAAQTVARTLGVNAPSILYGGAAIYDFQQERYLESHPFRWDIMQAVRRILAEFSDVSVQVFTLDAIYILQRNQRLDTVGIKEETCFPLSTPEEVTGSILKLVLCCDDPERLHQCRQFFPAEFCNFAFASRTFVDVVATGFGKGDALRSLSQLLNLSPAQFFSAGDAQTDLPMLRASAFSFAPQNASDVVKRAVTYVVPDVRSGGMAQAFQIAATHLRSTSLSQPTDNI